jgi:hypothetical protein
VCAGSSPDVPEPPPQASTPKARPATRAPRSGVEARGSAREQNEETAARRNETRGRFMDVQSGGRSASWRLVLSLLRPTSTRLVPTSETLARRGTAIASSSTPDGALCAHDPTLTAEPSTTSTSPREVAPIDGVVRAGHERGPIGAEPNHELVDRKVADRRGGAADACVTSPWKELAMSPRPFQTGHVDWSDEKDRRLGLQGPLFGHPR